MPRCAHLPVPAGEASSAAWRAGSASSSRAASAPTNQPVGCVPAGPSAAAAAAAHGACAATASASTRSSLLLRPARAVPGALRALKRARMFRETAATRRLDARHVYPKPNFARVTYRAAKRRRKRPREVAPVGTAGKGHRTQRRHGERNDYLFSLPRRIVSRPACACWKTGRVTPVPTSRRAAGQASRRPKGTGEPALSQWAPAGSPKGLVHPKTRFVSPARRRHSHCVVYGLRRRGRQAARCVSAQNAAHASRHRGHNAVSTQPSIAGQPYTSVIGDRSSPTRITWRWQAPLRRPLG